MLNERVPTSWCAPCEYNLCLLHEVAGQVCELATYLQPNLDLLGEGALGEDGLHLGHHGGAQHATLWPNVVGLLADAGHYGKVLREVGGKYAGDALLVQLFCTLQVCEMEENAGGTSYMEHMVDGRVRKQGTYLYGASSS